MSMYPYLYFTNTTRAAMTRYQAILGGQLDVMGAADMPTGEEMPFEVPADFVMHAALTFADGGRLMASDDPTGDGSGMKGFAVNITIDDTDEARRIFDALAEGGSVGMALEETFWSPLFGSCVDRFGVNWMVNVETAERAMPESAV